jgi:hypothetical protein
MSDQAVDLLLCLTAAVVGVVTVTLCIPMALGRVPRNDLYGFRTGKTLSSDEVWYPANRLSGRAGIVCATISICFSALCALAGWSGILAMGGAVAAVVGMTAYSLWAEKRLPP